MAKAELGPRRGRVTGSKMSVREDYSVRAVQTGLVLESTKIVLAWEGRASGESQRDRKGRVSESVMLACAAALRVRLTSGIRGYDFEQLWYERRFSKRAVLARL